MARPTWTRKTYEMAARVIAESLTAVDGIEGKMAIERVATKMAAEFRNDNPMFNLHRFLSACGFGDQS